MHARSERYFQPRMHRLQHRRAVGLHVVPVVVQAVDLLRTQGQIGQEHHVIAQADSETSSVRWYPASMPTPPMNAKWWQLAENWRA